LIPTNKDDFPLDSRPSHLYNGINNITGNREEILSVAEAMPKDAEGANLEQAKPDESLRQKDPVLDQLWKIPLRDTDGVKF
jgi:hypothetical protein